MNIKHVRPSFRSPVGRLSDEIVRLIRLAPQYGISTSQIAQRVERSRQNVHAICRMLHQEGEIGVVSRVQMGRTKGVMWGTPGVHHLMSGDVFMRKKFAREVATVESDKASSKWASLMSGRRFEDAQHDARPDRRGFGLKPPTLERGGSAGPWAA